MATLTAILDEMVLNGTCATAQVTNHLLIGQAEWLNDPSASQKIKRGMVDSNVPRKCLLYWKTPSEWAEAIYDYIQSTGHTNSILTVYELFVAEEMAGLEFHALPETMWRRAIQILEASNRARIFDSDSSGTSSMELGIKFF